jgi:DnaJ-class molecular chaperone
MNEESTMTDSPRERRSYYEILGVLDTATPKEVEEAFRKLAQKWHPDVCPDIHRAAANFKLIAEAYEVLGDPEKRGRYDEAEGRRGRRHVSVSTTRSPHGQRTGHVGLFGTDGLFDHFRGFESILESLFSSDWAPPNGALPQPRPELDVEAELPLTPEEAHWGGPVQFKLRFRQACPECAGQGTSFRSVCGTCSGDGRIQQGPRVVTVRVPRRVWNGAVIRIPGEGKGSPLGGQPGDLVLRVRVQPYW